MCPKKVPDQLLATGLEKDGPLKALKDTKLILNDQLGPIHLIQYPLFPKAVAGQVLFLDTWYSKAVLTFRLKLCNL